MKTNIYSIGHSNHTIEVFIALLQKNGVQCVVDVRRYPNSTGYRQFHEVRLAESLSQQGIDYLWLGELLGGMRDGGYLSYMETETFSNGLLQLVQQAKNRSTAFMCAENNFFGCHRRFIADALMHQGWPVFHILGNRQVFGHQGDLL